MALVLADRVRDTTTTTGTGTITLSGTAPTGYQNFSVVGNGNTTYYTINAASQWEVGIGTYSSTGPTLSRDTVLASSNAGSLVDFSSGTKDVFITYPAEKSVNQNGSVISAGSAVLNVANGGTGATSLTSGYVLKGNGTSAVSASVIYDDGTNVGVGTSSLSQKLTVKGASLILPAAGWSTGQTAYSYFGDTNNGISSTFGSPTNVFGFHGVTFSAQGSQLGSFDTSGNGYATASFRAPIFYDSQNTAYYVDAASNTILNTLYLRNSGIPVQAKFAQASQFGYSSSYRTIVLGNEYLTTISMGVDVSGNTSGSFNGGGEGREILFRNGVNFITPNAANNGYHQVLQLSDGNGYFGNIAQAAGSLRAPIYYDSNNTAYYVDPASGSVLNRLVSITGAGNSDGGNLQLGDKDVNTAKWSVLTGAHYGGSSEPKGVMLIGSYSASGNNSVSIGGGVWEANPATYIGFYTATTGTHPTGGSNRLNINGSGNVTAEVDIRAPIFYDSDNTSYYCNPTGNSVFNTVQASNIVGYYGWPGSPGIDANAYTESAISSFTYSNNAPYTGPFVALPAGGYGLQFNAPYSGGGNGLSFRTRNGDTATFNSWYALAAYGSTRGAGDLYANIYYDAQNSAYYVDPNSTSNLYGLTVAATISGYVSGCTFSEDSVNRDNITTRVDSGFYQSSTGTTAEGWPINDGDWQHMISCTHTNDGNYYAMQLGASFFNQGLFYRSTANSGSQAWSRLAMYGSNYGSSLYASIYYDAEDTGYYVDPAGYSKLYSLEAALNDNKLWLRGMGDSNHYLWNAGDDYEELVAYTGTGFRITSSSTGSTVFVAYGSGNGGHTLSPASSRAPIFYDSDNTAYFFNGSGTTYGEVFGAGTRFYTGYDSGVTNSMSCSNWFRSSGNTGWYNASYGGGIYMFDTTWVRVYNAKSFYVDADIAAAGNVTAYYSDERLKTKTGVIDNALDKVSSLEGFLYVENDLARSLGYTNEKQQVGVSAQAVKAVLPEAVSLAPVDFETLEDGTIVSKSGEDYLTVDYSRLVPLLIEAIKELKSEVNNLKAALH